MAAAEERFSLCVIITNAVDLLQTSNYNSVCCINRIPEWFGMKGAQSCSSSNSPCHRGRGLELEELQDPFNPNHSTILWYICKLWHSDQPKQWNTLSWGSSGMIRWLMWTPRGLTCGMSDRHHMKPSTRRALQVQLRGLLDVQDRTSKNKNRYQTTYRKFPNGQVLCSKLSVFAKHFIYLYIQVDFWTLKMH